MSSRLQSSSSVRSASSAKPSARASSIDAASAEQRPTSPVEPWGEGNEEATAVAAVSREPASASSARRPSPLASARLATPLITGAPAEALLSASELAAAEDPAPDPDNFGFTGTHEEHAVARKLQGLARLRNKKKASAPPTPVVAAVAEPALDALPARPTSRPASGTTVPSSSEPVHASAITPHALDSQTAPAVASRPSSASHTNEPPAEDETSLASVRSNPLRTAHALYATPTEQSPQVEPAVSAVAPSPLSTPTKAPQPTPGHSPGVSFSIDSPAQQNRSPVRRPAFSPSTRWELQEAKEQELIEAVHMPGALANHAYVASNTPTIGIGLRVLSKRGPLSPVRSPPLQPMSHSASTPLISYPGAGAPRGPAITATQLQPRSRSPSKPLATDAQQPQPLWRTAHDPAWPGLRAELGDEASAVFLDGDYSLVSLAPAARRVHAGHKDHSFVLQRGNEEMRNRLASMASTNARARDAATTLNPRQEKYSSAAGANMRAQRLVRDVAPLVRQQERAARKRDAARAPALGFVVGLEPMDPLASEADAHAARKATEAMERALLPPRVGLSWMPETLDSVGMPHPTIAHTQSTPNLHSPTPKQAAPLDSRSGANLAARAPTPANLHSHFSPTGRLVPLERTHHRGLTSNIHVASLANLSATRSLEPSVSESSLQTVQALRRDAHNFHTPWEGSAVSAYAAAKSSTLPDEQARAARRHFEQLPAEFQALLPVPALPVVPVVVAPVRVSPPKLKPTKKAQLSPLKALLSSMAQHEAQATENMFNKPSSSNPYSSLLLGNRHASVDEKEEQLAEIESEPNKLAYFDDCGRFFTPTQPPTRLNTSRPTRMRISSPPRSSEKGSTMGDMGGVRGTHLQSATSSVPSTSASTRPTVPIRTHDMSAAQGARPKYLQQATLDTGYSHSLAQLERHESVIAVSSAVKSPPRNSKRPVQTPGTEQIQADLTDNLHPATYVFGSKGSLQAAQQASSSSSYQHVILGATNAPLEHLTEEALAAHSRAQAQDSVIEDQDAVIHGTYLEFEWSNHLIRSAAAVLIQSLQRGRKIRQRKQQGLLRPSTAAPVAQDGVGVVNGSRQELANVNHAAPIVPIQSIAQGHAIDTIADQDAVIHGSYEEFEWANHVIKSAAATLIQALHRGRAARLQHKLDGLKAHFDDKVATKAAATAGTKPVTSAATNGSPADVHTKYFGSSQPASAASATATTELEKHQSADRSKSSKSTKKKTSSTGTSSTFGKAPVKNTGAAAAVVAADAHHPDTPRPTGPRPSDAVIAAEAAAAVAAAARASIDAAADAETDLLIAELLRSEPSVQLIDGEVVLMPEPAMPEPAPQATNIRITDRQLAVAAASSTMESYLWEQRQAQAALRIQSLQRGRLARRQTSAQRTRVSSARSLAPTSTTPAVPIVPEVAPVPSDAATAEEHAAATKLQALQRGKSVRKHAKRKPSPAARPAAAEVIEPAPEVAETVSFEEYAAAVKLQALARGRSVRKRHKRVKVGNAASHAATPTKLSPSAEANSPSDQQAAAIKLQALARGRSVRNKHKWQPKTAPSADVVPSLDDEQASATVDELVATHEAEDEDDLSLGPSAAEHAAATKMQALARGFSIRQKRTSPPQVDEEEDLVLGPSAEEHAAATRLQALARGRSIRVKRENILTSDEAQPALGPSALDTLPHADPSTIVPPLLSMLAPPPDADASALILDADAPIMEVLTMHHQAATEEDELEPSSDDESAHEQDAD